MNNSAFFFITSAYCVTRLFRKCGGRALLQARGQWLEQLNSINIKFIVLYDWMTIL